MSRFYCVHHISGDRSDNRPENLIRVTRSEHRLIHQRMKEEGIESKNKTIVISIYRDDHQRIKNTRRPGDNMEDVFKRVINAYFIGVHNERVGEHERKQ